MATETLKIVITADNKGALTSLQQTAAETDKFKMSLGDLNTRLSLLKERLNQATEPARITRLGNEIKSVTAQIEAQKSAYVTLGAESVAAAEKAGNAFSEGYSVIRKIAYIVPGIGIAGIFNLGFEAIMKAADALGLFSNKISESEKKLNDYNEVNKNANKNAGEEIATLKSLYDAATNVNLSMDTRNKAAKELQQLFPTTYGNLSLEVIKTGEAKTATDALTESIIKQARAKAALAKISEIEAQKLDIEDQKRKVDNATYNESLRVKGTSTDIVFGGGTGGIGGGTGVTLSVQDQQNRITERKINKYKELDAETAKLNAREKSLTDIIGAQNIVQEIAIENADKLSKGDTKKEYNVDYLINKFHQKHKLEGFILPDKTEAQQELEQYINAILPSLERSKKKDFLLSIGGASAIEQVQSREGGGKSGPLAEYDTKTEAAAKAQSDFNKSLAETQQIMSVVGPQIDGLFTALENGANIGDAIGNMFKKLAEDIAKAAIKALVFKLILNAVSGGTAGASASFGDIFKKMLGFAKGGISTGPQGGHMELLHGTEAILTPAQMSGLVRNSMNAGAVTSMGSNSQQQGSQQGEFTIRGNDLVLALQRSNYSLNLRRGV